MTRGVIRMNGRPRLLLQSLRVRGSIERMEAASSSVSKPSIVLDVRLLLFMHQQPAVNHPTRVYGVDASLIAASISLSDIPGKRSRYRLMVARIKHASP